jgi:hypothetical protein
MGILVQLIFLRAKIFKLHLVILRIYFVNQMEQLYT